jgi:hypothetical protein
MPSNTISYVIPANTRINKDSGDGAPNSVDITGGFSVTYTYNNAGVLTGQAVSAVSISTNASGDTFDNSFGTVGTIKDQEGATIVAGSNGAFTLTFQSRNEKTRSGDGSAEDFNTVTLGFTDPAATTASTADDLGPRSLEITQFQESYTLRGATTTVVDNTAVGSQEDKLTAACYTKGTLIMTATGEVAVEDLSVGDQVMTVTGALEPVIWLGNSTIHCERQLHQDKAYPVRILKDAFGVNLPKRDLFVSPDHSIYIDGVMIPAYCLINGSTITQDKTETLVTYYHLELPKHNAILAEGLPAESYLETSEENRHFFKQSNTANVTKLDAQYPVCPEDTPAWQHIWDTQGYAKLTQSGPILEAVKARLAVRSEELLNNRLAA